MKILKKKPAEISVPEKPLIDPKLRVAYTRPDGGVSIIVPNPEFRGTINDLMALHPELKGIEWHEITTDDLPNLDDGHKNQYRQRTYRNAWKIANGKLVHDMPAAKEIHLRNIRLYRVEKLKALDEQYAILQREGKSVTLLDKQRKTLLDATESVKSANPKTAEELYKMWPESLEKRK